MNVKKRIARETRPRPASKRLAAKPEMSPTYEEENDPSRKRFAVKKKRGNDVQGRYSP